MSMPSVNSDFWKSRARALLMTHRPGIFDSSEDRNQSMAISLLWTALVFGFVAVFVVILWVRHIVMPC